MPKKETGGLATTVLGFKIGTKTHIAATMYLRKNGATNAEIVAKNSGPFLNLLKAVEAKGHTVERTTRTVKGRNVKVYKIKINK